MRGERVRRARGRCPGRRRARARCRAATRGTRRGLLVVADEVAVRDRGGQRRHVREEVGLLERDVARDPRRRAEVEVGLEVLQRAGSDRGRLHVRRPRDDLDARGHPELGRGVLAEPADDVDRAHEVGQGRAVQLRELDQLVVVDDVVEVAVVRDEVAGDRVHRRDRATGEAEVQVVLRLQERRGLPVDVRSVVLDPEDVRGRVLARVPGGTTRHLDPACDLAGLVALDGDGPTGDVRHVRGATRVHPDDRVHEVPARAVDGHRAQPLRGAADADHAVGRDRPARHHPAGRGGDRAPPVVRVLLDATVVGEDQPGRLVLARDDRARLGHERDLRPRCPQVDRQHTIHPAHPSPPLPPFVPKAVPTTAFGTDAGWIGAGWIGAGSVMPGCRGRPRGRWSVGPPRPRRRPRRSPPP